MVRQNKTDLFFIGMIIAFAVIAMTSFSACSTTKSIHKEHIIDVVSSDSTYNKSTDQHIEVDASQIETYDSIVTTTIHEVITIYEVVYDTVGMPVILPSGQPMTYIKQTKDYTLGKEDSSTKTISNTSKTRQDSTTVESCIAQQSDSLVVMTEDSKKKSRSASSVILFILGAVGAMIAAAVIIDKISG